MLFHPWRAVRLLSCRALCLPPPELASGSEFNREWRPLPGLAFGGTGLWGSEGSLDRWRAKVSWKDGQCVGEKLLHYRGKEANSFLEAQCSRSRAATCEVSWTVHETPGELWKSRRKLKLTAVPVRPTFPRFSVLIARQPS